MLVCKIRHKVKLLEFVISISVTIDQLLFKHSHPMLGTPLVWPYFRIGLNYLDQLVAPIEKLFVAIAQGGGRKFEFEFLDA